MRQLLAMIMVGLLFVACGRDAEVKASSDSTTVSAAPEQSEVPSGSTAPEAATKNTSSIESAKSSPQEESPRMKCLQKCQNEHNACLAAAKGDETKKSECNKKLNSCLAGCPQN